ncbi:MAG: cell division topological specificity factor MinE [Ferrimonas sp.]
MSLLEYFMRSKHTTSSAKTAKSRLQLIIAHERDQDCAPDFMPALRRDLIEVISRYVTIHPSDLECNLKQSDDDCTILEISATYDTEKTK